MTREPEQWPKVRVLQKKISDDLGNEYELDGFKCGFNMVGFMLEFYIWQDRIPDEASRIDLDMVVGADDLRLHIKDAVIKVNEPKRKWRSKKESDDKKSSEKGPD